MFNESSVDLVCKATEAPSTVVTHRFDRGELCKSPEDKKNKKKAKIKQKVLVQFPNRHKLVR